MKALLTLGLAAALAVSVLAQAPAPAAPTGPELKVGDVAPDFTLPADDGSTVKAAAILRTIADDDADRADADRLAIERLDALYAVLTPDQQKQFDTRTIQSLRDPLGTT